jgi:hypothetical protein
LLKNSPEIAEKSIQEQFIEADKIKLKLRIPYRCTKCKDWLSLLESNAVKDLFLRRGLSMPLEGAVKKDGRTWKKGMQVLPDKTSVESSIFHALIKA